jgi:hypothetical protein
MGSLSEMETNVSVPFNALLVCSPSPSSSIAEKSSRSGLALGGAWRIKTRDEILQIRHLLTRRIELFLYNHQHPYVVTLYSHF